MITFQSFSNENRNEINEVNFKVDFVAGCNNLIENNDKYYPYFQNKINSIVNDSVSFTKFQSVVNREIYLPYYNNIITSVCNNITQTTIRFIFPTSSVNEQRSDKLLKDRPLPLYEQQVEQQPSLIFYWG